MLVQDVPTAYKSQQGGQYTLSTLLFFLKSRGLAGGQYIAAATKAGIPSVGFRDRKARRMQAPSLQDSLARTRWCTCRNTLGVGAFSSFSNSFDRALTKHTLHCLACGATALALPRKAIPELRCEQLER